MRRRARCRRADERVRVAQTRLPAASFAHRATDRVGPLFGVCRPSLPNSGIGRGIALALGAGAEVVVNYRDGEDAAMEVVRQIVPWRAGLTSRASRK